MVPKYNILKFELIDILKNKNKKIIGTEKGTRHARESVAVAVPNLIMDDHLVQLLHAKALLATQTYDDATSIVSSFPVGYYPVLCLLVPLVVPCDYPSRHR